MDINNNSNVLDFIKKFGFNDIDNLAYQKLLNCVDALLTNIYNNLNVIVSAYPSKRITKKQFAIILHSLGKSKCDKKITGGSGQQGRTVLPMQYFNPEHVGNYSEANIHIPTPTDNVSRAALSFYMPTVEALAGSGEAVMSGGGGSGAGGRGKKVKSDTKNSSTIVDAEYVKFFISKKTDKFILTKEAVAIAISIVNENISSLLNDCKNPKVKKLTGNKIYSVLKKHPYKYIHLSCLTVA